MDVASSAGAIATAMFAVSHVPMVVKAARTRDVHSYSVGNLLLVNAGNALWTVYVVSLPMGPIWALHSLYLVAGATMLALAIRWRHPSGHTASSDRRPGPHAHRAVRLRNPGRHTGRTPAGPVIAAVRRWHQTAWRR